MKTAKWILLALSLSFFSMAEPWLANRFAKNCASCHAPGRVNVEMPKRRCTLSCQGCHVNPSGGGIRNFYGKWNQERWLNSFSSKIWKQGKPHAEVYSKQPYNHKVVEKMLAKMSKKKRRKALKVRAESGIPFVETTRRVKEKEVDRHRGADEHTVVKNMDWVNVRIPRDDPWRLRRERLITAGGDFRYFHYERKREATADGTTTKTNDSYDFPMAMDFGVRVMPINKFSFVGEVRFANYPGESEWDRLYDQGQVRSAYFILDDLWYNTYVMKGLYRPMFGYYNPDHRSLSSQITELGYGYVANAISIGTNPNVPFFKIHKIEPTASNINKEDGYVLNAGARFIKYGASIVFSLWNTTAETSSQTKKKEMSSINLGFYEWGLIGNLDLVNYKRSEEDSNGINEHSGFYWLADLKYKLWREVYGTVTMANANTAVTGLVEGTANELGFGIKSFLLPGMELEVLMVSRNDSPKEPTASNQKTSDQATQVQFHWFF